MNQMTLDERVRAMRPEYERLFAERGGGTPCDPREFHLYYLARYWSRLAGFCRREPGYAEKFAESDLGACVRAATESADEVMAASPGAEQWREYRTRARAVLEQRPIPHGAVEAAVQAIDSCAAQAAFDPWSGGREWGR